MNLSDRDKKLMEKHLIPGYYLSQAAGKQSDIDVRENILKKAKELLSAIDCDHRSNSQPIPAELIPTKIIGDAPPACISLF